MSCTSTVIYDCLQRECVCVCMCVFFFFYIYTNLERAKRLRGPW